MSDDRIPTIGEHRGVGLQDHQDEARLKVVRADIDRVFDTQDIGELFDLAGDITLAPEARLLARHKVESAWDLAAETRKRRPDLSLDHLRARVAGLDSVRWRSGRYYASKLDVWPPGTPGAVKREEPLQ